MAIDPAMAPRDNLGMPRSQLADVIERNIKTLLEVRRQIEKRKTLGDSVADAIARFSGNLFFFYGNAVVFLVWILWNVGWLGLSPFDPYPFGMLTTIVSLEAIFLSTFVLISQNRLAEVADQRADLDLQIDLLAEYEITKTLKLVDAIADHLGIHEGKDKELEQLKLDVSPALLLQEMEAQKNRLR
jgi:uncharacterized membrane protein